MAEGIGAHMTIKGTKELQAKLNRLAVLSRAELKKELKAIGLEVQGRQLRLISEPGKGREYRRRSITHVASAPFDPPATDRGILKARIMASEAVSFENGGLTVRIGPRNYPVARYLEFGTRSMAPRPFVFRSLEEIRPRILNFIRAAIKRATNGFAE